MSFWSIIQDVVIDMNEMRLVSRHLN